LGSFIFIFIVIKQQLAMC